MVYVIPRKLLNEYDKDIEQINVYSANREMFRKIIDLLEKIEEDLENLRKQVNDNVSFV